MTAAKTDRKLVAELTAGHKERPVPRMIGDPDRRVCNAQLIQSQRDGLAGRIVLLSECA